MALTRLQRDICRLVASRRVSAGEAYLAGGAALGELVGGNRLSRDLDIFHDTESAVQASWDADRVDLSQHGYRVTPLRERPGFVEAVVEAHGEAVRIDWARDSAFRFFPLVEHPELGLALHPFDLATNKVLALIGRVEPRDWVDMILCADEVQPLGYLTWAACGKDPGFSPLAVLAIAARTARYSDAEIDELAFDGARPSAADLSRRWHDHLDVARTVVAKLPADEVGRCVVDDSGRLFRGGPDSLAEALSERRLHFHAGSIRGALPELR